MIDPVFRIIDGQEPHRLAARTVSRIKLLRSLQVRSAYYSDRERYGIAKEQCMQGVILSETEDKEKGTISFEIEEPDLGADEFLGNVAAVLFPDADVASHIQDIDLQAAAEALETFLGFIAPRQRMQGASSALQAIFRAAATSGTNQQAPASQSPTTTP
jgi:hypothetical protein